METTKITYDGVIQDINVHVDEDLLASYLGLWGGVHGEQGGVTSLIWWPVIWPLTVTGTKLRSNNGWIAWVAMVGLHR